MCGRAALIVDADTLKKMTEAARWIREDKYKPSYNIGPTAELPILRMEEGGGTKRILQSMVLDTCQL